MKLDVKNLTGHSTSELGTLAAGGLGMSLLEGALKKFAPTLSDQLVVAGTSVGPLAVAMATNAMVKNAQAKRVAKGVVAAAVVKAALDLGKRANDMIGLPNANAMSGVKYFPDQPMGRARFFPEKSMGAVKIVPNEPPTDMGAKLADQDPGDFGMKGIAPPGDFTGLGYARQYQSDVAEFNGIPEMGAIPQWDEDNDI